MTLIEIADGVTVEDILMTTGCSFEVSFKICLEIFMLVARIFYARIFMLVEDFSSHFFYIYKVYMQYLQKKK